MKKNLFLSLTLLFFLPVRLPAAEAPSPAPKPQYVIKWATIAPENTFWGDIVNQASREIEEASGGRIKNIWYFGAVMGDEPDAVRKLRIGQLQGLALLTVGLQKIAPEAIVYSLPDLFRSYEEVDCVWDRTHEMAEKIFAEKGLALLGRGDVGFSVFFSKRAMKDLEELKKAKIWVWSGLGLDQAVARMFGIVNTVPLSLPEVITALQTGMVDTVYGSYYTTIALQWYTMIKYMTDVKQSGTAYCPAMLVVKKEVFDSLPPEIREMMKEKMQKYMIPLREKMRRDEEDARQSLIKRGVEMVELDPAMVRDIRARAQAIYKEWEGKYYPSWFLEGILKARDQCRSELEHPRP
ncbi:MAG: TRAP transporter substrate-binding protein DctP [bacterium]|nr:TRAP transporter substrate-binding protein DctP [bacterium]